MSVFEDIGFPPAEAAVLREKAELHSVILRYLTEEKFADISVEVLRKIVVVIEEKSNG
jgi:hypothetical protein